MTSKIHPTAYIHESSVIDPDVEIGANTKIWHFCHVMSGAKIGKNCVLGQNVYVASEVVIGDNVHCQNNVSIYDGVTIEDNCFLGPSCVFTNVKFPRSHRKGKFEKTLVRSGATIGANATIICGVEIGQFAMIAAGAVLTRNAPPGTTMMGCPAVAKRNKNHHLEKLNI